VTLFLPRLFGPLDEWMQTLIRRCWDTQSEDRWLRLKFIQRKHTLRLECEAAGRLPETQMLQAAGTYLETESMGESFFMALETELT